MPITSHNVYVVDAGDPNVPQNWDRYFHLSKDDIIIRIGGACNGVATVMSLITQKLPLSGMRTLSFFGHGEGGVQGVSMGRYPSTPFGSLTVGMLKNANQVKFVSLITPYFAVGGKAILHGCQVAAGPDGKHLLLGLAKIWNVPVVGSDATQPMGTNLIIYDVITAYPDGSLKQNRIQGLENLGLVLLATFPATISEFVGSLRRMI